MEGKRFGKWEVLREVKTDSPGRHYECRCDCGKIAIRRGCTLRAKQSRQCKKCRYDNDRRIPMEGKKFGKWKVLKEVKTDKEGRYYECICDCGQIAIRRGCTLRTKQSRQCQECQHDNHRRIPMEGKKFGRWKVLKEVKTDKEGRYYECICDCGQIATRRGGTLRAKQSRQCKKCRYGGYIPCTKHCMKCGLKCGEKYDL